MLSLNEMGLLYILEHSAVINGCYGHYIIIFIFKTYAVNSQAST